MLMAREKASIFLSTSVALQGVRAAGAPSGCTDRDIGRRIQGMSDTVSSTVKIRGCAICFLCKLKSDICFKPMEVKKHEQ